MTIDNEYSFGEIVYLKTDTDQEKRIVTGFTIRPNCISYELSCGSSSSWHYGFEISKEKNIF